MAAKPSPKTPKQDTEKKKTVSKKSSTSKHVTKVTPLRPASAGIRTIDQEPGSGGLGSAGIGARED